MNQDKYQSVREAIVRACPELLKTKVSHPIKSRLGYFAVARTDLKKEPGIAEVLRSIRNNRKAPIGVSMNGQFLNCDDTATFLEILKIEWNLSKDRLSDQNPETINFLYDILVKRKEPLKGESKE